MFFNKVLLKICIHFCLLAPSVYMYSKMYSMPYPLMFTVTMISSMIGMAIYPYSFIPKHTVFLFLN